MDSSAPRSRKIASNLLWLNGELLRDPIVEINAAGRPTAVGRCAEPDRQAATEFYAGLLVADFPADWRAAFGALRAAAEADPRATLRELLPQIVPAREGILAVISGLEYPSLRLTERSTIRPL